MASALIDLQVPVVEDKQTARNFMMTGLEFPQPVRTVYPGMPFMMVTGKTELA